MSALDAAMMLARGERQPMQPRNGKGGFKGQQAQSSDQPADDGHTLRLTLQSHHLIRQTFDSTSITVLIDKEQTKSELANLIKGVGLLQAFVPCLPSPPQGGQGGARGGGARRLKASSLATQVRYEGASPCP